MKKIININLSGRVIPIEDSAYDAVQAYIESLRRYFAREEGRDEIINDIQSRIAELMSDKIRKGASCVTDADVSEIIGTMGRPEDFDAEEGAETSGASQNDNSYNSQAGPTLSKGRLYRDTSDKFIGGVCSGVAAYLNVDPAIVRILFAIVTFGGFGVGFLLYIVLWIILPPRDLDHKAGKRLFRNPEDRVIGGVASGLAAYFNARASTVRLIFAAPLLLSIVTSMIRGIVGWHNWDFDVFPNVVFGSLTGTFIFVYIVLWIVLPEARSPYEKMEMRGEKVDVNRIKQNVQEGMENMKDRMQAWGQEVKESAQDLGSKVSDFASTRGKTFANEVSDVTRRVSGLGHAIGVLFKVFFLFIAGTIAFALFVALVAILFSGAAWWPVNSYLWTSNTQQTLAWGTLIFFLIVPLVALLTWVIRRVSGIRSRNNYLGWTFGGLWTIGWICAVAFAASVSNDFRYYETTEKAVSIAQPPTGKMTVVVSKPELEYTGQFGWMDDDANGWDLTKDSLVLSIVQFDVRPSVDSTYRVVLKKHSYGKTEADAINRADKMEYTISSHDSILDLDNGYAILKENKFRGQQVEVEIHVPVGKKIRFDESVKEKLNPSDIKVRRGWRNRGGFNIDIDENRYWNNLRSNTDYTMGANGKLVSNGEPAATERTDAREENPDGYRYRGPAETVDTVKIIEKKDIEKTIEQKRQELRELEEQKKKQESRSTKVNMDDDDGGTGESSGTSSAILSFVNGVF